jgi:hypothetical protein
VHPYTCPTTRAASPHKPESLLFPFTALELPPLQHLTTIAQKQNKPLKRPKRVNFLPQQKRHTTITIATQTEKKQKKQNKSLTTYNNNNNNNNNTVTCCKTFQTSK